MAEKVIKTFYAKSRQEWRQWLEDNHSSEASVWLIYYKKKSGKPTLTYGDAVDEALCFGWIDSTAKPVDEERFMQYFTKRKPASVWSRINKERVGRLIEQGLMAPAGYAIVVIAKQNGSWNVLDEVEALVIPEDLAIKFRTSPAAQDYFNNLNRSDKRNILQWLVLAKRHETRQKRIVEIVKLAEQGQKPKQFR